MINSDLIRVLHGLPPISPPLTHSHITGTYKLVVDLNTLQDQSEPVRSPQLAPFLVVRGVNMFRKVPRPVDTCALRPSVVGNAIDVPWPSRSALGPTGGNVTAENTLPSSALPTSCHRH